MKGYFLVAVGDKYAVFTFSPYKQMEDILRVFEIPFSLSFERPHIRRRDIINSKEQKIHTYEIDSDRVKIKKFYFTNTVIDKVLNFYKVRYKKMEGKK